MPKIGMPSCSMILSPWSETLRVAAENDFEAFEVSTVFPSVDLDQLSQEEVETAREVSERAGMEVCVHAPFFELNIAAYCGGVRETSIRYIEKAIGLCAGLGGEVLIIHTGDYTYDLPKGATKTRGMNIQWDNNIESLKEIYHYAGERGITLCLENLAFNNIDQSFEDLLEIRAAVGDGVKFTLDVGHARLNAEGGVEKGIELLGDNIRHIHFTDNNGAKDDHFPIGDGNFEYSGFMDFIKDFQHVVTLEVVSVGNDPEDILRSRDYFNTL